MDGRVQEAPGKADVGQVLVKILPALVECGFSNLGGFPRWKFISCAHKGSPGPPGWQKRCPFKLQRLKAAAVETANPQMEGGGGMWGWWGWGCGVDWGGGSPAVWSHLFCPHALRQNSATATAMFILSELGNGVSSGKPVPATTPARGLET